MVRQDIRSPRRAVRLLGGGLAPERCPACGGRVVPGDEHVVRIHFQPFHAACALYRRRGAAG
jgi:hypothetical protein